MAASHIAIMDAVYALLQEKSVRDLTMEEVAKRAKVGKPTLYKWCRLRPPWCCNALRANGSQPGDTDDPDRGKAR